MKNSLLAFFMLFSTIAFSQDHTYYAAAKAGLSMRELPGTNAKVLEKIPYGAKVIMLADTSKGIAISTEGFDGWWWKVQYNGKVGYVVNSYVLPVPPPKTGINNMKDYMAQVSSAVGKPIEINKGDVEPEGIGTVLKKQMYKNGMEWHQTNGYEYGAEVYILPDITIEQAFLIIRLLGQYPNMIGEKDPIPSKSATIKKETGDRKVTVEKDIWYEKVGVLKRLSFYSEEGALTELQIFLLDSQAVIYYSSGV